MIDGHSYWFKDRNAPNPNDLVWHRTLSIDGDRRAPGLRNQKQKVFAGCLPRNWLAVEVSGA